MSTLIEEVRPVERKRDRLRHEQRLVLHGVDWATYRAVSDAFGPRHVRFTYDRGRMELVTKSQLHRLLSRLIARLIMILTEEVGLPLRSCGDMTCDREDLARGIEPDECFYITSVPLIRGKEQVDLTTDPPPDLGVEVDVSYSSFSRLGIYAALRVPEVWRFDTETLYFYRLGADGQYAVAERSHFFPFLVAADLARFLNQWPEIEDDNVLAQKFRAWVRERIAAE